MTIFSDSCWRCGEMVRGSKIEIQVEADDQNVRSSTLLQHERQATDTSIATLPAPWRHSLWGRGSGAKCETGNRINSICCSSGYADLRAMAATQFSCNRDTTPPTPMTKKSQSLLVITPRTYLLPTLVLEQSHSYYVICIVFHCRRLLNQSDTNHQPMVFCFMQ
jgi:hypothetical protein